MVEINVENAVRKSVRVNAVPGSAALRFNIPSVFFENDLPLQAGDVVPMGWDRKNQVIFICVGQRKPAAADEPASE